MTDRGHRLVLTLIAGNRHLSSRDLSYALSPDGKLVAVKDEFFPAHPTGHVHLIDLASGAEHARFKAETTSEWVAFAPDGQLLAYAACEGCQYRSPNRVVLVDLPAMTRRSAIPVAALWAAAFETGGELR